MHSLINVIISFFVTIVEQKAISTNKSIQTMLIWKFKSVSDNLVLRVSVSILFTKFG